MFNNTQNYNNTDDVSVSGIIAVLCFIVLAIAILAAVAVAPLILSTPLIPMLLANAYGGPQLALAVGCIIIASVALSNMSHKRHCNRGHYSIIMDNAVNDTESFIQEKPLVISDIDTEINQDNQPEFLKNLLDMGSKNTHCGKLGQEQLGTTPPSL